MVIEAADWLWLDARRHVGQAELSQMCGLSSGDIDELVDFGAIVPLAGEPGRKFSASCVAPLREAARLRAYYDLDLFTVSLLIGYLQRIMQLEQQMRALHAHMPHPAHLPREGPAPWREEHA